MFAFRAHTFLSFMLSGSEVMGGAASFVVLKLNDLFVGKDNLSDLFMGGQFQHFFGIRNIHFSRNSEPWMSPE